MSLFWEVLGILLTVLALFYSWTVYYQYTYWQRKNIPFIPPNFPFGNLPSPFSRTTTFGVLIWDLHKKFDALGVDYGGVYFMVRPALLLNNLDLVKRILIKDFDFFPNRGLYYNEKNDPLSAHLFSLDIPKWKHLRVKLTPTFTSGKMKMMFKTLAVCAPSMLEAIDKEINQPVDIKEISARFTTDVIGSCAFGLECNSFKDNDSPFRKYGDKIFERTPFQTLKATFVTSFPGIAHALNLTTTPKDLEEFFLNVIRKTLEYRKKNHIRRNDFIQLLTDMGDDLSFNELAAQCFVFFIAGFETSATTMTFTLYNLARNPEIQEKLRNEINCVLKKHNNKLTYEAINDMIYLRQVIDEGLRLYPPLSFVNRTCIKDYELEEGVLIKKGTLVIISVLGIHHNDKIYPNPEVFDPERFTDENKKDRHPNAFIPFGDGPRNCIGLRFGLMQSKVGLVTLLKNYKFTVSSRTKEPLQMDPESIILSTKGQLWLNATKISS